MLHGACNTQLLPCCHKVHATPSLQAASLLCPPQADVKAQQEKLAQLTMVLDKAGSHTPLAALAQEHAALKERNAQQQARADEIVSARLAAEQKTRQVCRHTGQTA